MSATERKAAAILAGIAASEGTWVFFTWHASPARFWQWMGFTGPQRAGLAGWALALVVAGLYVRYSALLPSVRKNLVAVSLLKLLAVAVAVAAGLCEEAVFRKALMDALARSGGYLAVQAICSGLAFGAVHAVWGLMKGSWRAALSAMIATGSLGLLLALVYLVSGRSLLPCVAAHFAINFFAEPGLVLAALSGEMGRGGRAPLSG